MLGSIRLQRSAIRFVGIVLAGALLLTASCGYKAPSSSSSSSTSHLTDRVFVSQSVSVPSSSAFPGGVAPGLFIVDGSKDVQARSFIGTQNNAGTLVLAPNKSVTLVMSAVDNSVALVNNAGETTSGQIVLPGPAENLSISPTATFAFAPVPNAPLLGQAPGALYVITLSTGSLASTVPIPGARFVSQSHNGNRLLVFSENSDSVTVVDSSNIGTSVPPSSVIGGFDRPVAAFFSTDDSTAYVLNCGAECGGTAASVQKLDLGTETLSGSAIPVDAATTGLLSGNTLYVAGTPAASSANSCAGQTTAATVCGRLSIVDLNAGAATASYGITDGYHDRIDLSDNGQLFVGAKRCTTINTSSEVRGCLSVFNTLSPGVVFPPKAGDVTGLQAIPGRNRVYVAQGGELWIYDTVTDQLVTNQIDLSGNVVDVKLVDF